MNIEEKYINEKYINEKYTSTEILLNKSYI